MKTILLSLLVLLPLSAYAQTRSAPARPNPRATPATVRPARNAPPAAARVHGLPSNVTLNLKGSLQGQFPIDIELTGCGPLFRTDAPVENVAEEGTPPPILNIEFVVTQSENSYRLEYSVGARVAVTTSSQTGADGATQRNISFRDLSLGGSAIIKMGETLTLSKIDGKRLAITMTEPAKEE